MRPPIRAVATVLASIWLVSGALGCGSSRMAQDGRLDQSLVRLTQEERAVSAATVQAQLRESMYRYRSESGSLVSPRLLDLYLAAESERDSDPALVLGAYFAVLGGAPRYTSDTSLAHVRQHLALTELLYADRAADSHDLEQRSRDALEWWISKDYEPAEVGHYRLLEHIKRIAEARTHYPSRTSLSGLDARGETYVRYGPPHRTRQVFFNEADLIRSFMRDGIPVRENDFPNNEVWMYDQFGQAGLFLFVEQRRGHGYELGSVNDLLPRQLRNRGVARTGAGTAFTTAALKTLRYIFSQLSLFHPAYSSRYDAIAEFVNWQEEQSTSDRLGGRRQGAVANFDSANRMLDAALTRNRLDDDRIADRRASALPDEYAGPERPMFPLVARAVRFVGASGATVVRTYWSVDGTALAGSCLPPGIGARHAARVRLVEYSDDLLQRRMEADDTYPSVLHRTAARPYETAIEGSSHFLALQVDRLASDIDGRPMPLSGSCTGVVRIGPLSPINVGASGVALSDLLPFRVDDVIDARTRLAEGFRLEEFEPLLVNDVAAEQAVGIYFEVYSSQDLGDSHIIEYQAIARSRGNLLRRGQTRTSVYYASQAVVGQRLPAALLIDRAEWAGADEIEILVTVTNVETGAVVEQSLTLSARGSARTAAR